MVGVEDRDVKWDTHDQVVAQVRGAARYLKITVVTPVKAWVSNRRGNSIKSCAAIPSTNVTLFSTTRRYSRYRVW